MGYSVMRVAKLTSAQLANYVGSEGMIVINSDTDSIVVLDGQTPGGADVPTEADLKTYVDTQVGTITAAGGQILPATSVPTTDGSVVVWDGGSWQEDNRFAFTSYVDSEIAALSPSTGDSSAGQALQWIGGKLVNYTIPSSGGGGGLTVTIPSTQLGEVLYWDAVLGDFKNASAISRGVAPMPANPSAANETIYWDGSNFQQRSLSGYSLKPASPSQIGEALTWSSTGFQQSNAFSVKPSVSSLSDEVLAWDASLNSGNGGFVQKDLSALALDSDVALKADIGSAATYTDLGLVEAELANKAPNPPTGIQAGEFLRWDETGKQFTFATPAGGGGGTSIPTPTASTDYTTPASMEVLIWDNASGDLKNVASPFTEKPPASASGEYLSWNSTLNSGTGGWVNSTPSGGGSSFGTPASSTQTNEAVTWDGTSAFVNTTGYAMLTDIASKANEPSTYTGSNEVLKWTASGWQNATLSSVGVSSGSFASPSTNTTSGQHVAWNGSAFENRSEFATESLLEGMFPLATDSTSNRGVLTWNGVKTINKDFAPASATPNGEFVKWNGTTFENVALSTTGMTTTGFVNPASGSGFTDALQWDATSGIFKNVPNFRPDSTIDTSTGTDDVLGWDGTQFYKKTLASASTGGGVLELTHDTVNNEYVLSVKASAIASV